jgi:ABC-type branched-subunit amino acid transport system ATPase component
VLEFDGAAKRFGAVAALDGCTFVARPGRLTGFLGPNGAGKTTAMRAVFGLVALDAGTLRLRDAWRGPTAPRSSVTGRRHASRRALDAEARASDFERSVITASAINITCGSEVG